MISHLGLFIMRFSLFIEGDFISVRLIFDALLIVPARCRFDSFFSLSAQSLCLSFQATQEDCH